MKSVYSAIIVKYLFVIITFLGAFITEASAQAPITSVSTTYKNAAAGTGFTANGAPGSPLAGNTYNYNYGNLSGTSNNNLVLNSFTAGGITYLYYPISNSIVKMRRVDNAQVTGIRNLKFDEGTQSGSNINISGEYDDDMESFFNKNNGFNQGTDNLFSNSGDGNGNNNNIERVDVIFPAGTKSSDNTKVGFSIFERGNTGAHDGVKAALILGLNGAGAPNSYSNVLSVTSANYNDVAAAKNYIISRRDNSVDAHLTMALSTSQPIGGVFFKYSDFGVANNTRIYGYSLFCPDFTGTPAQAVDYTNATFFPTNTDGGTFGISGIDLIAVTGVLQSTGVLEVNMTSFTAKKMETNVLLNWTSLNETNSKGFEVERSVDGNNYVAVGTIAASVNSVTEKQYSFNDEIKLLAAPLIYYRIKMINQDNSFVYSLVVVIRNENTSAIKIYPQPITAQSYVEVDKPAYFEVKLFDINGKILQRWNNVFISPQQHLNIYNTKMIPGTYYIQLFNLSTKIMQEEKLLVK